MRGLPTSVIVCWLPGRQSLDERHWMFTPDYHYRPPRSGFFLLVILLLTQLACHTPLLIHHFSGYQVSRFLLAHHFVIVSSFFCSLFILSKFIPLSRAGTIVTWVLSN
jgi:hypothetical protein